MTKGHCAPYVWYSITIIVMAKDNNHVLFFPLPLTADGV